MRLRRYKLRETIYKYLFKGYDLLLRLFETLVSFSVFSFLLLALLFLSLLIFDLGFEKDIQDLKTIFQTNLIILTGLFVAKFIIFLSKIRKKKFWVLIVNSVILLFVFLVLLINSGGYKDASLSFLNSKGALITGSFCLIISEAYRLSGILDRINVAPSILFAGSFLFIILFGTGLLMMPNATVVPISFINALFTSTSAVCVTGLVVVDTATAFTPIGKGVIMALIQLGGLGIMAFTGFFSYIFLGTASIKDRLILRDIFSGEQIGGMFRLLSKIIFITLIFEGIGALVIYFSLQGQWHHKMIASVFHSISAFCNAGFALIPGGLANHTVQFNYTFQITICMLIVLGGLGFPVLVNFYNSLSHQIWLLIRKILKAKREPRSYPFVVGQRIAFQTTIVLIIFGALLYYFFENTHSMSGFSMQQKIMTSIFGSVSARTAGFNMVDLSAWGYPIVYVMIFLMWIGASPGSTGGGIKTTTFAIALKATINFCRGRKYLEIGNREIGMETIVKVMATIFVSILLILLAFILLLVFEPYKNPTHLLFECVSAFATVGLSLVNTATLGFNSKIVLILLMFIGRIGPVILLSGLLISRAKKYYRLPVENIGIN